MSEAKKAPRTIHYALIVIRQAFNHAARNELYTGENPVSKVSKPRYDNRRQRFLTYEEAGALLDNLSARSQQLHDIALMSLHCGLRAGEIFELRWGNINFDQNLLTLMDTKSGKSRAVYMTQNAKQVLERMLKGGSAECVFRDRNGNKIKDISNSFMAAVTELKLNEGVTDRRMKVVFHTLRHTYASWLVQEGVDLYAVKELLGHSTLVMTERYSHLRKENLISAVKKLERSIEHSGKGIDAPEAGLNRNDLASMIRKR
jgi:site-specific recombinase XerD